MAWDASRPVPWRRLVREWLIYVAIMAALFLVFFRDNSLLGVFAGLLVSGPLYLCFGYVLAKFGYQRTTRRVARERTDTAGPEASRGQRGSATRAAPTRPKPVPTRRTGSTSSRPGGNRRR